MNATEASNPVMTYPEAARFCRMSERSLFTLAKAGHIPTFRPTPGGRGVRFRRSDLEKFIEQSARAAAKAE